MFSLFRTLFFFFFFLFQCSFLRMFFITSYALFLSHALSFIHSSIQPSLCTLFISYTLSYIGSLFSHTLFLYNFLLRHFLFVQTFFPFLLFALIFFRTVYTFCTLFLYFIHTFHSTFLLLSGLNILVVKYNTSTFLNEGLWDFFCQFYCLPDRNLISDCLEK